MCVRYLSCTSNIIIAHHANQHSAAQLRRISDVDTDTFRRRPMTLGRFENNDAIQVPRTVTRPLAASGAKCDSGGANNATIS